MTIRSHEPSVQDDRPEIDLAELLKSRIAAGEAVYVTGNPQEAVLDAVTAAAEQAAAEMGASARVIQVVELPDRGLGKQGKGC